MSATWFETVLVVMNIYEMRNINTYCANVRCSSVMLLALQLWLYN
jgi:hypothetical protein